ncbi:hypothetical protein EVAR_97278_1 [Eumeta japonica]|uniref:Uncharacterized protein n=1 Tax=Eumeta variegata TaxID=151549 RepID=A0A4C1XDB1_EUMVA|nr:hypothetical protein EVAR_97278_1 [Eumeta japonica]
MPSPRSHRDDFGATSATGKLGIRSDATRKGLRKSGVRQRKSKGQADRRRKLETRTRSNEYRIAGAPADANYFATIKQQMDPVRNLLPTQLCGVKMHLRFAIFLHRLAFDLRVRSCEPAAGHETLSENYYKAGTHARRRPPAAARSRCARINIFMRGLRAHFLYAKYSPILIPMSLL